MSTGRDGRWPPPVRASSRLALVVLILLAVVTVASCASGGPTAAAGGAQAQAWQAVTACIRSHGMPEWPDPTVGPDGQLGFPVDAPHTTDLVQRACAAQFEALSVRSTATAAPMSSRDLSLLVRLAQCLRSHGFPTWPDPGPDGRFPYPAISALPNLKQVLRQPPLACRSLVPQGGLHVAS